MVPLWHVISIAVRPRPQVSIKRQSPKIVVTHSQNASIIGFVSTIELVRFDWSGRRNCGRASTDGENLRGPMIRLVSVSKSNLLPGMDPDIPEV